MTISTRRKKILVMNLTRMGDLVQSTPLLSGLRAQNPDAEIVMMVSKDFAEFSNRLPGVDRKVVFDLRQFTDAQAKGETKTWVPVYRYLEEFLNGLDREQFDVVYNLSHSKLSALMIAYLNIFRVCGFRCNAEGDRMTEHPWLQYFFTEPFNRPYNTFNLVDIFSRGGDIEPRNQKVQILCTPEDDDQARKALAEEGVEAGETLIAIQAGSSLEGRRWPAVRFAELADKLADQFNARILLLGVSSETPLAESIMVSMKNKDRVLDLTGKTSIGALAGVLKLCDYLVTNDTGTMHIAAAVGTPIVGLFFAHAHPPETGPYAEGHLILQARIACAPCSYGVECNNIVCIEKITPDLVFSLMNEHRMTGKWKVSGTQQSWQEVNAFETGFDADHCLEMRPLIKHPVQVSNVFAHSYRRLWLDLLNRDSPTPEPTELKKLAEKIQSFHDLSTFEIVSTQVRALMAFLQNLEKLAGLGLTQVDEIDRIYRGSGGSSRLQGLADGINRLDEEINLIGMTHPEIKPLTDMFNKRKENLDGADVSQLAKDTRTCYQKLQHESRYLLSIIEGLLAETGEKEIPQAAEVSSMSMQVPGR